MWEKIHDVALVLANNVATSEELRPLNSAQRDLSDRMSAPPPPRQPPPSTPGPISGCTPSTPLGPSTEEKSLTTSQTPVQPP